MLMKCINTSCKSTRIKVINQANGSVLENGANLVGAAVCFVGCFTPFHGAANKAAQSFWKEGTKSIKVTYKCLDCGCTWEETKWVLNYKLWQTFLITLLFNSSSVLQWMIS